MTTDEAFTHRVLHGDHDRYLGMIADDGTPPLHFLLLRPVALYLTDDENVLRAVSLLFTFGAIALAFYLAQRITASRRIGWFAAIFTAVSGTVIEQGFVMRFYPLALMLVVASHGAFLEAWKRPKWYPIWGMLLGLAMLAHHFAALAAIAQGITLLIRLIAGRRRLGSDQLCQALLGLIMAIAWATAVYSWWLPGFLQQAADVSQSFWVPPITATWAAESVVYLMFSIRTYHPMETLFWLAFGAGIVGYWMVSAIRRYRETSDRVWEEASWLALFLIPTATCIAFSYLSGRCLLQERYLIFAQAAWCCFLARVLGQIEWSALRISACCLFVSLALSQAIPDRITAYRAGVGCRESLQFVQDRMSDGERLLVEKPWDLNVCKYYFSRRPETKVDVRFIRDLSPKPAGHEGHISVCTSDDIWYRDSCTKEPPLPGLWTWSNRTIHTERGIRSSETSVNIPPGYVLRDRREFGEKPFGFVVSYYQPANEGVQP